MSALGGAAAAADTEARLRLIGYLIMHTRQLDMVMNDPAAVDHYGARIRADLAKLLAPATPIED
jgi:pyruvate,water dikinase